MNFRTMLLGTGLRTHTLPLRLYRHALWGTRRHFIENVRGVNSIPKRCHRNCNNPNSYSGIPHRLQIASIAARCCSIRPKTLHANVGPTGLLCPYEGKIRMVSKNRPQMGRRHN